MWTGEVRKGFLENEVCAVISRVRRSQEYADLEKYLPKVRNSKDKTQR